MQSKKKTVKADPLSNWLAHHIYCLLDAVNRMRHNLGSSSITILMITVALAIPLTIYSIINPFNTYLGDLEQEHQVTIFLTKQVTESSAKKLIDELANDSYFYNFVFIPANQALADFAEQTELPVSLELLGENPLPNLITATANTSDYSPAQLQQQIRHLEDNNLIEQVVFDYAWLVRLQTMVRIAAYIGVFLLILLSVTVVLVIINTVRWEIEARRDEFKIIRLIGGTDRYIRRPFLYIGFVTGGLGAIFAVLLVTFVLLWIDGPIEQLFELYESQAPKLQTGLVPTMFILLLGTGLGLLGAWVAAALKLRALRSFTN